MRPFTLNAVLVFRKRQEDIAQHRYFEACRSHAAVSARLDAEKVLFAEVVNDRDRRQQEGVEINALLFYEERIAYLDKTIKAMSKTLAEKAALVSQELNNLQQKNRERQIMEKLKEQQNRAWQEHLNKKERAMFDEIAVIRHAANQEEQGRKG
jgi:flagellar FliJ protein